VWLGCWHGSQSPAVSAVYAVMRLQPAQAIVRAARLLSGRSGGACILAPGLNCCFVLKEPTGKRHQVSVPY
jgi:hypothetical protein